MNIRERIVGECLMDRLFNEFGCLAHFQLSQLGDDGLGLLIGGGPAFLGMDGLQHVG